MNTTQRLLDSAAKRGAQQILAVIDSRVTDGSGDWNCKLIHNGFTVRASGQPGAGYAVGQTVILSRPDGSGLTANTLYSIIAFSPALNRGSSGVAATSETKKKAGTSVTLIAQDGSPVTSVSFAPNTNVTIVIYGVGLDTATITYGSASLADNVAPDRSIAGRITLVVHAALGMTLGQYDLTIGSTKFARFFNVTN